MHEPIDGDRVRTTRGTTFGWIDHGLMRRGWLARMSPEERDLYLFLCLAADRRGLSWYAAPTIARKLGRDVPEIRRASAGLRELDLVAFRAFGPHDADGFHQVLSLPRMPTSRRTATAQPTSLSALLRRYRHGRP